METYGHVASLFLLMLVGFLSAKRRWLGQEALKGMNQFVILFALPSLTIVKLQVPADAALLRTLFEAFLLSTLAMCVCYAVSLFLFRKQPAARRAALTNLAAFSNSGFMGYPIIEMCLGGDALIYAVMFVASFNILAWSIGVLLFAGKGRSVVRAAFLNTAFLSACLGIAMLAFHIRIPGPIANVMTILGATTTPLSFTVIGARLAGVQLKHLRDKGLPVVCFLRLILFPLLFLCVLRLLGTDPRVAAPLFLCYAMPSAAATAMQAEKYHTGAELASVGVSVTTALSVLSIPFMLLFIIPS